jgi:hypothetical protein
VAHPNGYSRGPYRNDDLCSIRRSLRLGTLDRIRAVTRGMNATEVVGLAVVAIIVAIAWSRRA